MSDIHARGFLRFICFENRGVPVPVAATADALAMYLLPPEAREKGKLDD